MKQHRYAGIDIGTGSARIAICEIINNEPRTKYFELFSHNLGEDNKSLGYLQDDTMDKTIAMFAKMLTICEEYNVSSYQFAATEAIRAAKNSHEFLEKVKAELGIEIRILNEQEEAHFAYMGAKNIFNKESQNVLVMDIGRGSIETALGSYNHNLPLNYVSHKLGTFVFKDRFNDKTNVEVSFNDVKNELKDNFEDIINKWNVQIKPEDQLISLGMSLFTYGYINDLSEDEMVKCEGKVVSLDEIYTYSNEQLENLKNNLCHKENKKVLSKSDMPVLATLIALMEASKLDKITLGRTKIPQALALQLSNTIN